MKLQYLGTAAAEGWPAPFCHCQKCETARRLKGKNIRSRPQVLINDDLLVDFGPDTYYHSLRYELDLDKIKQVLLTHSHCDHFYPKDLILRAAPYAYGQSEEKMHLYGNEACRLLFDELCNSHEAPEHFDTVLDFTTVTAFETFYAGAYEITALRAMHDPAETCLLYSILGPDKKRMLYGNDTGGICAETWKLLSSMHFDLVSLDCTMGNQPGCSSHMSLTENAAVRERMLESGCADDATVFLITHFSHGCCPLHEELSALGKECGFLTAYDGLAINI